MTNAIEIRETVWRRLSLKWAGGKYSQLADLEQYIPAGKRLIEPFVGGGSIFMNSKKHADFLLADVNPDLILSANSGHATK